MGGAGAPDGSRAPLRRETSVRFLRGVGPQRSVKLAEAGLAILDDLLFHLPSRYEDRRRVVAPGEVREAGTWTVRGQLSELRLVRTRRRGFVIVRGRLTAGGAALPVRWFNQPYLLERYADGDEVVLHGGVRASEGLLLEMVNPTVERAAAPRATGRIVPVYPAVAGLGPAQVGRLLDQAVAVLDHDPPPEPIPAELLRRYALPALGPALRDLHRPGEEADLDRLDRHESAAHQRLVYGELLDLQLELAELRSREIRLDKQHEYRIDDRARAVAREVLPFRLTDAQKRVVREIVDDLRRPQPMLRLLQGDVGSGKTIVAALALLLAAESGLQGAFMAPTELLAEQHHAALERLLGSRYRIARFTSSAGDAEARRALARGEIDLAIGTHALIQSGIEFRRLALAVIDEQHRFGVEQRRLLQGKGARPDVLVMTATPIPRSLALTFYGDLEISVLDELPPGRTPVVTEIVPAGGRREVYRRLRDELARGAQAYVVVPLIEESEELAAASLEKLGARVREFLAGHPAELLHGRLPAAERERVMRSFVAGELQVLIATTVIEVGVDVPNASWMVIESAERFGLAQLHQLRGRVGRGRRASRCVAIHGKLGENGARRLEIFAQAADGFAIAEADLSLRGPGDLLGTRQAGLPRLRVADLVAHRSWIERARQDARELHRRLDEPEHALLAARVRERIAQRGDAFAGG
ncbi:MAG TPA: ATP-dependent DNA helicase RecG [Thermoanaerobaculia bacterium]|nr:ATP-dependent DNA helicase RecG [Thermoanaerobaculia bacterium]